MSIRSGGSVNSTVRQLRSSTTNRPTRQVISKATNQASNQMKSTAAQPENKARHKIETKKLMREYREIRNLTKSQMENSAGRLSNGRYTYQDRPGRIKISLDEFIEIVRQSEYEKKNTQAKQESGAFNISLNELSERPKKMAETKGVAVGAGVRREGRER